MSFRRNDARRRRLAIDPVIPAGVDQCVESDREREKTVPSSKSQSRHYAFGANRRCQAKTTDLIPKRVCAYLLVVLGLLAMLWLITFLARQSNQWSVYLGESGMRLLSIRGQGSLASWFSSFLLIITGMASLQIYALRKHRCDDYRGAYRLWGWMAAILILASINCVSDLTGVLGNLTSRMFVGDYANRAWIPFALKLVALSVLTVRGIYEVRASLGSLLLVIFVWSAYVAAIVLQYPATKESLADLGPNTMLGNCLLFGTTGLFLAHLTYARYVFLDAHGLIKLRVKSKKSTAAKNVESNDASTSEAHSLVAPLVHNEEKIKEDVQEVVSVASQSREGKSHQPRQPKPKKKRNNQQVQASSKSAKKEKAVSNRDKSPSEILKEMAEASRAKEKRRREDLEASKVDQSIESAEMFESVKMSKSQRRKQRKLKKQQRRAA